MAVEAADIGLLAPGCWHRKPGGSHWSREARKKEGCSRREPAVAPAGGSQRAGQHDQKGAPGPGDAGHASRLRFAAAPEVAALTLADIQPRDYRWRIVDRIGKHGPCRAIPMSILSRSQTRLTGRGHVSCVSTETIMVPRVRADNGLHQRLHPILYLFGVGHPVPTRPPYRIALRERYAPGPTRPPFEIRA